MAKAWSRKKKYESEAALCEEMIGFARQAGFKAYAETSGFDVLLVATEDAAGFDAGDQIGVQAKLAPNIAVLAQALPCRHGASGPHFYAVLVPHWNEDFRDVAARLQITVLVGSRFEEYGVRAFRRGRWYRQETKHHCWVPECEVEGLRAGVQSPTQLTPWKMGAVKLSLLGAEQGYLTREDFARHQIALPYWIKQKWVTPGITVRENGRRFKRYDFHVDAMPPHVLYAEVTVALKKVGTA